MSVEQQGGCLCAWDVSTVMAEIVGLYVRAAYKILCARAFRPRLRRSL
jgi:hypothetical protein